MSARVDDTPAPGVAAVRVPRASSTAAAAGHRALLAYRRLRLMTRALSAASTLRCASRQLFDGRIGYVMHAIDWRTL